MTKVKGVIETFDGLNVSGIDGRVWQKEGTSTDNIGVYFSLDGEIISSRGIRPLFTEWRMDPDDFSVFTPDATPFMNDPVTSLGAFTRDGITDLLVEWGGNIGIVEGNSIRVLVRERHVASGAHDSTRFVQVGNNLIIINGRDPNIKWDGEKITPLGIATKPTAPSIPRSEYSTAKIGAYGGFQNFFTAFSIEKTATLVDYRYKLSWVSEFGQDSELSAPSNEVSDNDVAVGDRYVVRVSSIESDPPQDDIIGRNLWRTTDGLTYYLIRYLSGTTGDDFIDYISPLAPLGITPDDDESNSPPPLATFAFYYKGRTYYSGNPETPTALFYSKDDGGKEAVPPSNVILIGSNVADHITGFGVAGDYVLVFKERSTYMLTQDKEARPIITPVSNTIGAISDKAVVGFEGKVYFISLSGFHAFDGSNVVPLSKDIASSMRLLPRGSLRDSFGWSDPDERRVYFSVVAGPGTENNEVWTVHVDTGALSKLGVRVSAAINYKRHTIVGYNHEIDNPVFDAEDGTENLGVWGAGNSIYHMSGDHPSKLVEVGIPIYSSFETRWLFGEFPENDKTFKRIDIFYVQTGSVQEKNIPHLVDGYDNSIVVRWYTDWDRDIVGSTRLVLSDPDALVWGEGVFDSTINQLRSRTWGDTATGDHEKRWDGKRIRSKRLNISVSADELGVLTNPKSPSEDESGTQITAKSIKFEFVGIPKAGYRIIGFMLQLDDHGLRAEGTDHE